MIGKKKEPVEIPVYMFLGFLDSGKTTFIQETMEDPRFNDGVRTLLLSFEEGEEEYDVSKFASSNVYMLNIDDKEKMNEEYLTEEFKKSKAMRVVVEYNGMWNVQDFFEAMPEGWMIAQCMFLADASTFNSYNANMRSLVVDKLNMCEMVAFNRMKNSDEQMPLHKIVRGVSRRCVIVYDYGGDNTVFDEIEDPLPFDVNAPVIEIEDKDFALWYRDLMDDMKQYHGKTVKFKGICAVNPKFPDNVFVCGRHIMTCCVQDITYCGLAVKWDNAKSIKNAEWVTLEAKVEIRFSKLYGRKGPVLTAVSVTPASEPEEKVATFY